MSKNVYIIILTIKYTDKKSSSTPWDYKIFNHIVSCNVTTPYSDEHPPKPFKSASHSTAGYNGSAANASLHHASHQPWCIHVSTSRAPSSACTTPTTADDAAVHCLHVWKQKIHSRADTSLNYHNDVPLMVQADPNADAQHCVTLSQSYTILHNHHRSRHIYVMDTVSPQWCGKHCEAAQRQDGYAWHGTFGSDWRTLSKKLWAVLLL